MSARRFGAAELITLRICAALKRRAGRLLPHAGACVVAFATLHCARPAAREIEAFREVLARSDFQHDRASADQRQSAERALDDVVVALLNSESSPEAMGRVLAFLPGSDAPKGAGSANVNAAADWPDYASAYTLFPIGTGASKVWVAVYVFGGGRSAESHLSVFSQSGGRWHQTDALDASNRLYAYPVLGLSAPAVAVIDHYGAADGWLGALQVWTARGKLSKHGSRYEPLRFYVVNRGREGPLVKYSEFPKCLGVSVSQLSLSTFELSVGTVDGQPDVQTVTTSPWVVAVDTACAAVRAGGKPEVDEPLSQATGIRALRPKFVILWAATGDAGVGTGSVTVTSDAERLFRFDVRRWPDGAWRIERVTEESVR